MCIDNIKILKNTTICIKKIIKKREKGKWKMEIRS